jgi:hypothetical protein
MTSNKYATTKYNVLFENKQIYLPRHSEMAAESSKRYAYAFGKELTYELTANEKDYVYEKLPAIRLSSKVSLELYGRITGTNIYK